MTEKNKDRLPTYLYASVRSSRRFHDEILADCGQLRGQLIPDQDRNKEVTNGRR